MEEETVIESGKRPVANEFTKDIARYFKSYLETGLYNGLLPIRHIDVDTAHDIASVLHLQKYPQLRKNVYKNIISGFTQEVVVVGQNKYVVHADDRASDILARSVESIHEQQVSDFIKTVAHSIEKQRLNLALGNAIDEKECKAFFGKTVSADLVIPMLRNGRESVKETSKAEALLQKSATQSIVTVFGSDVYAITRTFYEENQSYETLVGVLQQVFSVDTVKRTLREFLYEFTVSDAYQDVYRLHRRQYLHAETKRMYVTFSEIKIGNTILPLFCAPVSSAHSHPSVNIGFENQVIVNVQAIEFALHTYSQMTGSDVVLPEIAKKIVVDIRKRKQFADQLQSVVDMLTEVLGLGKRISLDSVTDQEATNGSITLTNALRFVLFDASKESVVDDYEKILSDAKSGEIFAEFIQKYALETPSKYVQEIKEEWDAKSLTDKLVSANPLPLNDEQRKALLALNKPECDVVVVNGPPGTGKSHFISAVVAQSLADGSSTLVLSDTSAALDAVQGTVTNALGDVRSGTAFHNPLLRLGRVNEEYLEDLEAQFIKKIQAHHKNYMTLQSELKAAKKRKVQDAADELSGLIQGAEGVNLHEVEQTVNNESKFGDRNWIHDEPVDEITEQLHTLHQAVQYIQGSEANYLLPYIESSQQKAIAEFLEIVYEYEKASKNVRSRLPDFIVRYRKLLPDQKDKLHSALSYIHSNYRQYTKALANDPITACLEVADGSDFRTIAGKQLLLNKLVEVAQTSKRYLGHDNRRNEQLVNELLSYQTAPEEIIAAIGEYIDQVMTLKSKIFGFSGRTLVVENLTRQLKKAIPEFSLSEPEKRLDDLQLMSDVVSASIEQLAKLGLDLSYWKEILHVVKQDASHVDDLQRMIATLVVPADFEFMANYRVRDADNLLANITLLQYAAELNTVFKENSSLATLFGVKTIGQILAKPQAFTSRFGKLSNDLNDVKQLDTCKKTIKQFIKTYPEAAKRLGINYVNGNLDVIDDTFACSSAEEVKEYLSFKKKEQDITNYFKDVVSDSYYRTKKELQQINATQLSYNLDAKLLKYVENQADAFTSIKHALNSQQQINATMFTDILKVFPCVLGTVDGYAEYVPLKKGLFDVVVIDEASHISAAEALPALLRAKKVVILGDDKQYTTAAATQVSDRVNETLRNRIVTSFVKSLGAIPADTKNTYIGKIRDNLNVTTSILQFGTSCANAEVAFTKYFRSPKELVKYVHETFYGDTLRCLKALALPIKESVKFDVVETLAMDNQNIRTNEAEAKYIFASLLEMKEAGYKGSVGVITPYDEQAMLIQKYIDESVVGDWFAQRRLKIMTFDTSHGEDRDYIFYSMVATTDQKHIYAFPEVGDTKANHLTQQRLAVGFSRASEVVHFITSKPIEEYDGELRAVLESYRQVARSNGVKPKTNTTDILLAAESLVPQYFYATKFYKKYTDRVRLVTHFSLGDLLQPLIPRYQHPDYKVDFMIVFEDQRIIVTYDEFKENFISHDKNMQDTYLTASEIYHQKELENYGYTFLRLNRFNLGTRPIEALDTLLAGAVAPVSWPQDNGFVK